MHVCPGRVSEAVGIAMLPGRAPSPPSVYHLPSVLSLKS